MMSKEELTKLWSAFDYIFKQSRLPDVRRRAKESAMQIEKHIGPMNGSAEYWNV